MLGGYQVRKADLGAIQAVTDAIRDIQGFQAASQNDTPGFIGELADSLGISAQAVRFYEREGLISPQRIGRYRTFRRMDVLRLKLIVGLRGLGFGISEIKEIMEALGGMKQEAFTLWFRQRSQGHLQHLKGERERLISEIAANEQLAANL
jgi:DNA-binding transcriptional MerR regulator